MRKHAYHSLLIRCWQTTPARGGMRFIVETVSGEPRRWGCDTFEELTASLRQALVGAEEAPEPVHSGNEPAGQAPSGAPAVPGPARRGAE